MTRWSPDQFRKPSRWSPALTVPQIPGGGPGGGGPVDPSAPGLGTYNPPPPSVRFVTNQVQVEENVGLLNIQLGLNYGYPEGVLVRVQQVLLDAFNGMRLERDVDWTWSGTATDPNISQVYFAPGALTANLQILIINDIAEETIEATAFQIIEVLTMVSGTNEPITGGISGVNECILYVGASDTVGAPVVTLSATTISVAEGQTSNELRVQVSEAQLVAITGNLIVTPLTAGSGDYSIPATYTIPAGQTSAPIPITATADGELEVVELVHVQLDTPSFGTLGTPILCSVAIFDNSPQPIVEWQVISSQFVENQAPPFIDVQVVISNANEVPNHTGCVVEVNFSGSATPGVDYFIQSSTTIGFAPGQFIRSIRLSINPDTDVEPDETVIMQLVNPDGCAIGQHNVHTLTIINDDQATGGAFLRPSLYYPSEVFHIGGETRTIVVDLGAVFEDPVTISYEVWEGPNTDPFDHGLSATGNFASAGGSRYAFQNITVPASSTVGNQKRFIVNLTATTNGELGLNTRFVGIIQGDSDIEDLIPPRPVVPGTDDLRVWKNRYRIGPAFGADIVIPAGVESIGWALRHNNNYQALWGPKNPVYPKWFQEGVPVVVRVMEDVKDNSSLPIGLGVGAGHSVFGEEWIALGNPSSGGNVISGARDLIIIGDGPSPKQVRGFNISATDGWEGNQNTNVAWPTMAVDNIQFRNLEFIPVFDTRDVTGSTFQNPLQKDHHGLVHVYDCNWNEADALLGGPISAGNFKQGMRVNTHMSLRIEGCTMKGHEHSAYLDRMTGLCLFYNNNSPGFANSGNGRTMIQIVARPNEFGGGGPGHGLVAVVNNTTTNNGWRRDTGAKDISVYGHNGEVYMVGNLHNGHLQENVNGVPVNINNRGFVGILMSGNQDGIYTFLFPLLSGYWAGFKNVEWRDNTFDLVTSDVWNSTPFSFNGCANLVIGNWTVIARPPLAGRDIFQFNASSVASASQYIWDPNANTVVASDWTTPAGFSWSYGRFPNRPDSITYVGGPLSMGYGTYMAQASKSFGSFRYGSHGRLQNSPFETQVFSTFPTTSIDAYNGRDLT